MRPDWEDVKLEVMKIALRQKFNAHPTLVQLLLLSDRGDGKSGAGCCAAHGGNAPRGKARDVGRGQELRHAGIRPRTARDEHHPTCGAEHEQSEERGGRADSTRHAGYEVSQRKRKRGGAIVRLDEDDWERFRKVKLRGIDNVGVACLPSPWSCLQLMPIAKPDG